MTNSNNSRKHTINATTVNNNSSSNINNNLLRRPYRWHWLPLQRRQQRQQHWTWWSISKLSSNWFIIVFVNCSILWLCDRSLIVLFVQLFVFMFASILTNVHCLYACRCCVLFLYRFFPSFFLSFFFFFSIFSFLFVGRVISRLMFIKSLIDYLSKTTGLIVDEYYLMHWKRERKKHQDRWKKDIQDWQWKKKHQQECIGREWKLLLWVLSAVEKRRPKDGLCLLGLCHSLLLKSVAVDLWVSAHSQYGNSLEEKRCFSWRLVISASYREIHSHRSCHSCRSPSPQLTPQCTHHSLGPFHSRREVSVWSHRQIHFD